MFCLSLLLSKLKSVMAHKTPDESMLLTSTVTLTSQVTLEQEES